MEKYGKWNDRATGINPFTPFKNKVGVLQYILMSPVMLLKLLIFIIMSFSVGIVMLVFSIIPIVFIRRFFERYISFVFCYAFFILFGFYNIKETLIEPENRKTELNFFQKHLGYIFHDYQANDILICNWISYVQVLFFGMKCSPLFVTLVEKPDAFAKDIKVVAHSNWFKFILSTYIFRSKYKFKKARRLSDVLEENYKYSGKPVVVFLEGASTNGMSLLQFQDDVFDDRSFSHINSIHVIGFSFRYNKFSPCFHLEETSSGFSKFVKHVFGLWSQIFHYPLEVVRYSKLQEKEFESMNMGRRVKKSRKIIEKFTGKIRVEWEMSDKVNFTNYWNRTQKKGYSRKKE